MSDRSSRPVVADAMLPIKNTISAGSTVREAAILMDRMGLGSVMVEEGGKIVGILTEKDLVRRVIATGLDHSKIRVRDVMSYPLVVVKSSVLLDDALHIMRTNGFRRLPVVDDEGRLLGMVTMSEAVHIMSAGYKVCEELLRILVDSAKVDEERLPMYG
ncbi:MAG: CBS domain-containing protein [Aigarchaeota archaeon]|nr:CBS domain-containing protein [Aigarchaeota archaeon]MDW8092762.1 CBS domain-containing protein [Nitrososphaerota archaeon]